VPPDLTRPRTLQVLPAIRALARKLDVDLNLVQATGPGGMVTRADVERAAKSLTDAGPAEPLKGMRRAMAQRMASAHAEVVPTTVTDEADIGIGPRPRHYDPAGGAIAAASG
jgi:pyruvate dehydrogenase E2 component (dihydrolipoamide acetyltransferase)